MMKRVCLAFPSRRVWGVCFASVFVSALVFFLPLPDGDSTETGAMRVLPDGGRNFPDDNGVEVSEEKHARSSGYWTAFFVSRRQVTDKAEARRSNEREISADPEEIPVAVSLRPPFCLRGYLRLPGGPAVLLESTETGAVSVCQPGGRIDRTDWTVVEVQSIPPAGGEAIVRAAIARDDGEPPIWLVLGEFPASVEPPEPLSP